MTPLKASFGIKSGGVLFADHGNCSMKFAYFSRSCSESRLRFSSLIPSQTVQWHEVVGKEKKV